MSTAIKASLEVLLYFFRTVCFTFFTNKCICYSIFLNFGYYINYKDFEWNKKHVWHQLCLNCCCSKHHQILNHACGQQLSSSSSSSSAAALSPLSCHIEIVHVYIFYIDMLVSKLFLLLFFTHASFRLNL